MSISPAALAAKKVIEAAWLHGTPYDLASQAAFALESARMLQQPVPVGPMPQPLALTEVQIDALAEAGNRVVNDAMHEHLCMCDAWPEKCVSTGNYYMGAWDVSGLEDALPAVLALWEQMRGGELLRLRARVAELEGAPADGITRRIAPTQALREDDVMPQVKKLRDLLAGQRAAIEDDPYGLHHTYRVGRDLPEMGGA
ncbi:hypothetical protein [Streptomyces sp. NPDC001139]